MTTGRGHSQPDPGLTASELKSDLRYIERVLAMQPSRKTTERLTHQRDQLRERIQMLADRSSAD